MADGKNFLKVFLMASRFTPADQNIVPFTDFLASLVEAGLKGQMTAKPPSA